MKTIKSTEAKPGKPIVMKLREDEEPQIMEWLNLQGMYSDSIRYLIQKEIAEHGLRNLQVYVPQTRTIETIKAQLASAPNNHIPNHNTVAPPYIATPSSSIKERESIISSQDVHHQSPTESAKGQPVQYVTADSIVSQNKSKTSGSEDLASLEFNEIETSEPVQEHSDKVDASSSPEAQKRKAKKTFGTDVANSYAN